MKPKNRVSRHHRVPRSRGGSNSPENIKVVRESDHRAYHQLFGNMLAHEIAAMLTDTWIDGSLRMITIPRIRRREKKSRWVHCTDSEVEILEKVRRYTKEDRTDAAI